MKSGLRMAGRMLSYHLVAMVVSLLFLVMMSEQLWLQILLNVLLLAAYAALLYNDGGTQGEKACTLSVTLQRQREEGRAVDPKQQAQCFSKSTALIGYAFGVLPLLLLAVLNLIVEPFYPAYIPSELESEGIEYIESLAGEAADSMPVVPEGAREAQPAATDAPESEATAQAAQSEELTETGSVNWVNVVARAVFSPYISVYGLLENNPHLLNLLFVLFALAIPVCEPIGYLRGPKLRQKKLEMIQKGKKRKMKNLRVNKKPNRGPKPPKMEV